MPTIARILVVVLVSAGSLVLTAAADRGDRELDGFVIAHVPEDAGDIVSDYSTEWKEVDFASRVWERRDDGGDGYSVDLKVNVLRGDRLEDLEELRDFLAEYHEHDPDEWDLEEFRNGEHRGYRTEGQAFWLVEPGVAVSLTLDPQRFDEDELLRTAWGVQRLDREP